MLSGDCIIYKCLENKSVLMVDTIKNTHLYLQVFYKCTYEYVSWIVRTKKRQNRGLVTSKRRSSLYHQFIHTIQQEFSSAGQIPSRWLISFQLRTMLSLSYLINSQIKLNCSCMSPPDMRGSLKACFLKTFSFLFQMSFAREKMYFSLYTQGFCEERDVS